MGQILFWTEVQERLALAQDRRAAMANRIPSEKPPRDNTFTPNKTLLIKLAKLVADHAPVQALDMEVLEWLASMRAKGLLE